MARGKFNKRGGGAAGNAGGRYDRRNQDDDLWGWNTAEQQNKKDTQDSGSGSESGSDSESDDEVPVQQMKTLEIKGDTSKLGNTSDSEEKPTKVENLNRQNVKTHFKASDINVSAPRELSRREREAKEKKDAQARYWKLHMEGKTDQAKSDLARLAAIRKKREEAAAAKKAEAEIKEAEQKARNEAKTSGVIKNRYGF